MQSTVAMPVKAFPVVCFVASVVGFAAPLRADDQPFLTIYTTDIDGQDEREVEQWLGWKAGQTSASHDDLLSRTEVEYGITHNLQSSLYLNYERSQFRSDLAPFGSETENSVGVSGELIWRLLDADFDPFGFALYVEPSWNTDERAIEAKILLQKNLLNDALRCALNVNFEDDWGYQNNGWQRSGELEFDTGVAYALTSELSAALEFDNERAFDGLIMGGASREEASAFFFGPTIDYEPLPWKITFGAQAQLPWATSPRGNVGAAIDGFEAEAERFRIAFRLTRDF